MSEKLIFVIGFLKDSSIELNLDMKNNNITFMYQDYNTYARLCVSFDELESIENIENYSYLIKKELKRKMMNHLDSQINKELKL